MSPRSRPHGGQNASQSSGRAASEDDGLVEGQLHDLLKFLYGWLGRQGRLHSVHGSGKVDEDMFLTEVEFFFSDAKVRSIDAFQKWLASPKSSGYSYLYNFRADEVCSRFLCVLKTVYSYGQLSEQVRLFHTHRAAPPSPKPVTSASSVSNKSPNASAFSRNPHRCPVCGVSSFQPVFARKCCFILPTRFSGVLPVRG